MQTPFSKPEGSCLSVTACKHKRSGSLSVRCSAHILCKQEKNHRAQISLTIDPHCRSIARLFAVCAQIHWQQRRLQNGMPTASISCCNCWARPAGSWPWSRAPTSRGLADRALLALLLACGLRRHEAVSLRLEHLQQREDHWAIVDLLGKGGHIRTVPIPDWVVAELNEWLKAADINKGRIFRKLNKTGHICGDSMTEKAVWHVVKECAKRIGVAKLAPHDLRRRTCAKLCQASGGELEQIQFLLGHVSVQTTERYLGCKQRIRSAVNDRIGIEPRH